MNSVVLPIKVHAVKLEYRRLMLANMIHGHFKMYKGRRYVCITKDPDNPKFNSRHPRRLLAETEEGKRHAEIVSEYQRIKAEYTVLLNDWNARYSIVPPRVSFPIIQFADPHAMNNEFYEKQKDRCGDYKSQTPTVSEHGELKSKNEQMAADLLKSLDIPFKYEPEVYFVNTKEMINPDYLISFYEIDRCAYLEILGMNDKGDYSVRTAAKINGFSKDIYRPGREVIYVLLYDKANFDEDYFVSQVLSAFNDMIPDNCIVWKAD